MRKQASKNIVKMIENYQKKCAKLGAKIDTKSQKCRKKGIQKVMRKNDAEKGPRRNPGYFPGLHFWPIRGEGGGLNSGQISC